MEKAALPEKMKAILKVGPHPGLEMVSVSIPSVKDDEVLIKTKAVSVCGTDLHIYKWNDWARTRIKRLPLILGHEFAGEVVESGQCVSSISVGGLCFSRQSCSMRRLPSMQDRTAAYLQ